MSINWDGLFVNEISLVISNQAYEDWEWLCAELALSTGEERHAIFARLVKVEADRVEYEKIKKREV